MPIDGSKHSQRALERALYLAELCQAQIGLLYVIDLASQGSSLEQVSLGSYIPDDIKEAGRVILNEALKQVPHTLKTENFLGIGVPAESCITYNKLCRIFIYI